MRFKTIITLLLALVALTGQAKDIIWENPSAFMGNYNGMFFINQVELKPTETVLHITANYLPHNWIRFDKHSYLQTPDGKKYGITNGLKTNEQESDLTPDSLFWMPESGMAQLALHFKPVPLDTKVMDFLESYNDGDFKFWNICDGKTKREVVIPEDWKNVKYAKDETLPAAKIKKGIATIKVKMLGFKKGMELDFFMHNLQPLGSNDRFNKVFRFADDGTVKFEVPLWLTREVTVGVEGMANANIVIGPDQETNILMKVTSAHQPFVAFKGYMAKTNMDLTKADNEFETLMDEDNTYLKVRECNTSAERLQCLTDIFNQRTEAIKKTKYTTAAKDLLYMEAERQFAKWTRNFASTFSLYGLTANGMVYRGNDHYLEDVEKNKDMLTLPAGEANYTWKYLNEPGSPCSAAFWNTELRSYDLRASEKSVFNTDVCLIPTLLRNIKDDASDDVVKEMLTDEDCRNVVREYMAEQRRIAQQLGSQEHVFYQKLDNVAPENILQTILDKYKGKAVLIDIWATWCGPCKAGHAAMKPWKKELKGKNIQFVYITSPTSPLATWQEMIKDIDGDHYYLTKEQYNYILDKYESQGIPTYAIYDAQGNQTFKNIGFPGLKPFKVAVDKVLK
ncbi:redoxin family protein [Prevotella communis]|uniref:TlpA family protein disulfide reductase n=1 Tax=Prevotella communis TaxID=2913614 RepID=UPI001EDAA00E|nr:TlpA disulfide reductase family protein [Prevotella communis]UKK61870.1 redoxin family protein [Prevotella communis]UKK64697.1 redoxin family protein [Prevotella communis]UKK67063.1 redoxin family protein [Prevotella communis]UKK70798.1 redoxin family protein [Prevotella communis]